MLHECRSFHTAVEWLARNNVVSCGIIINHQRFIAQSSGAGWNRGIVERLSPLTWQYSEKQSTTYRLVLIGNQDADRRDKGTGYLVPA